MKKLTLCFMTTIACLGNLSVQAQDGLGLEKIRVDIGFVSFEGANPLKIAVNADLGNLTDNLKLETGIIFWSQSEKFDRGPLFSDIETSTRDFGLLGGTRYEFSKEETSFSPFANAGLGLHFLNVSTTGDQNLSFSATDTEFGLYLGGGTDYQIAEKILLSGQLTYHTVSTGFLEYGIGASISLGH